MPFTEDSASASEEVRRAFVGADGRTGPAVDRQNIALDKLLDADAQSGGVTLNPTGGVSRQHYAARLSMDKTHLCKVCASTLRNWDARLLAANGGLKPIARAFVDLVEHDRATHAGVARWGSILNVRHYAERLGTSPKAIKQAMGNALKVLNCSLQTSGELQANSETTERDKRRQRSAASSHADRLDDVAVEGAAKRSGTPHASDVVNQAMSLRLAIEQDDEHHGIRLNHRGGVLRSHYGERIGVRSSARLCPEAKAVLDHWDVALAERNGGMNPLAQRFVALVRKDQTNSDGVVIGQSRTIDLAHYARRLGCSTAGIRFALGSRLAKLNDEVSADRRNETPLCKRLRAAVIADAREHGHPQFGRSGNVHRGHYAKCLGVSSIGLAASCQDVLVELDQVYGADSNAEARVGEMRTWLEERFAQRKLRIVGGKVDRSEFQKHFGLTGGPSCFGIR